MPGSCPGAGCKAARGHRPRLQWRDVPSRHVLHVSEEVELVMAETSRNGASQKRYERHSPRCWRQIRGWRWCTEPSGREALSKRARISRKADCPGTSLPLVPCGRSRFLQPVPFGMYLAYAILAFAEVFVLFASVVAVLVLVARAMIRACCRFKNEMRKSRSECALSRLPKLNPCWLQCPHRLEPGRT